MTTLFRDRSKCGSGETWVPALRARMTTVEVSALDPLRSTDWYRFGNAVEFHRTSRRSFAPALEDGRGGEAAERRGWCCGRVDACPALRQDRVSRSVPTRPLPSLRMHCLPCFGPVRAPRSERLSPTLTARPASEPAGPVPGWQRPGLDPCHFPRSSASAQYAGLSSTRRGLSQELSRGHPFPARGRTDPDVSSAAVSRGADGDKVRTKREQFEEGVRGDLVGGHETAN